jgi:hypothetical protein
MVIQEIINLQASIKELAWNSNNREKLIPLTERNWLSGTFLIYAIHQTLCKGY